MFLFGADAYLFFAGSLGDCHGLLPLNASVYPSSFF